MVSYKADTAYAMSAEDKAKLDALGNEKVWRVVCEAAELMKPRDVMVVADTQKETADIRRLSLERSEERALAMGGHSVHYDGYFDQGRDRGSTAILLAKGETLSRGLNVAERETALRDILRLMDGAMAGRTMIVRFFCLGPAASRFALCALQITDSFYVAHSEDLLYRPGYEQFRRLKEKDDFFYFWHSAGRVDARGCSLDVEKRRIYVDPLEGRVFSVNTQYAGNTVACKKLSFRLGIHRADREGWLAEHMFISAFSSPGGKRKTYVAGAYPSACGKTSTAMIPGARIVGDDIAYLRIGAEGEMRGVNVERGVFGIIRDVNARDDPVIYEALTTPKEMIFSNVLTTAEGKAYWEGMGLSTPNVGMNHAGDWKEGMKDAEGNVVPLSHPNARFTLRLSDLSNVDSAALDAPEGVRIDAILYGGRDSSTGVPVVESLDWRHGVFIGATIESETTAAVIGATGVRRSDPMANVDFVIIPLGRYLSNHLAFGRKLKHQPRIFGTNYFLKGTGGEYLNGKLDKKVWLLWAEGRVHGEFDAILTPVGRLPKYGDLKDLFSKALGRDYTQKGYAEQFSLRIGKYLEKFDRMEELYRGEREMPPEFWEVLESQRKGLISLRKKHAADTVSPLEL